MDGAQAGDRCPTTDVIMSQCVGGRGGCDAAFGVSGELAKPQPRERAWDNQRGKKTLLSLTLVRLCEMT